MKIYILRFYLRIFGPIFATSISIFTICAQPVGGSGRSIVPGTHFVLTANDGNFVPATGADWVVTSGWRLVDNEDAVRSPVFDLNYLQGGNLKWYAKIYSPQPTYVTFVEWYGSEPSTEAGNTHYTGGGTIETYSGELNLSVNYGAFSLEISKSWYPLDPVEPDYKDLFVTEFWIEADDAVLPVRLVNFGAIRKNNSSFINWTTLSEQNSKGFEIERSMDGRKWSNIGFVKAKSDDGNSSLEAAYSFVDSAPLKGDNLYRLKQVDYDGKYQYSSIRQVSFEVSDKIVIYPNPANDYLEITGINNMDEIKLIDRQGNTVKMQKVAEVKNSFSLNGVSSGIYLIHIISNGRIVADKLIVKR
jgi:hypothetical protein